MSDARTVKRYTGKRKGETGDLGQRSRESKWIMIGFNQISTTNKIFPGSPNHFTIRISNDLPAFQDYPIPLPYFDMRCRLSMAERRYVIREGLFRHFRKRYKHRALAAKKEIKRSVGGLEATIRPRKTREREHRRE